MADWLHVPNEYEAVRYVMGEEAFDADSLNITKDRVRRVLQHAREVGRADHLGQLVEGLVRQRQQPALEWADPVAQPVELGGAEHRDAVAVVAEALERIQHLDHTLVRAGGAAEEQQAIVGTDAQAAARLRAVVTLRVEELLVARVRHDQPAVTLLERDVRDGDLVGRADQRLAGLRPRLSERQREIGVRPAALERRRGHAFGRTEERELVVVDIEHEGPVRHFGAEDSQRVRRKPRLRDEERVGVDAPRDSLHDREVLGKHPTVERVHRDRRLAA